MVLHLKCCFLDVFYLFTLSTSFLHPSSAIKVDKDGIRLVGGSNSREGRVEVHNNGLWGSVCVVEGTDNLATSVCRILEYGSTGIILLDESFGQPDTAILYDTVNCEDNTCDFGEKTSMKCESLYIFEIACGDITECEDVVVDSYTRSMCTVGGYRVTLCPGSTNTTYRISNATNDKCFFTNKCSGVGAHYQLCGCPGITIDDRICTGIICFGSNNYDNTYLSGFPGDYICDGYYDCDDKSDEDSVMCAETIAEAIQCTPQEKWNAGWVIPYYQCDSDNDCEHGEDEINCGHENGIYCDMKGSPGWADNSYICDNKTQCDNGQDELDCDWTPALTCESQTVSGTNITLTKYEICKFPMMGFLDGACAGYIDQLNCTDKNAIYCPVLGHPNTSVRKYWLCNSYKLCDDEIDEECMYVTDTCYVHKHQLCDGIDDCEGGLDEKNCRLTPQVRCQRRLVLDTFESLQIPLNWLCDGVVDCMDGEDEDESYWMVCGEGEQKVCRPKSFPPCDEGFRCPDNDGLKIQYDSLCNYHESCGGAELDLCLITKDVSQSDALVVTFGNQSFIPPCLPGLISSFSCTVEIEHGFDPFSESHEIFLSESSYKCSTTFGLQYRFLACRGKCSEGNVSCKLQSVSDTQCDGDNISHMLSKDKRVTKALYVDDTYHQDIFVCDNKKCISPALYCNLIDDCGDGSDERDCVNSYKCQDGSPSYVRKDQECDGNHDCFDSSDECNSNCINKDEHIINGLILKVSAALIGITSTVINIHVIAKGIRKRALMVRRVPFTNQLFVSLIAIGDFCVGIYLINVCVVDFFYLETYCTTKFTWLTSLHCSFIGVLTTFGSQLSLFSMVALSVYRATSMRNPFGKSHVSKTYIVHMTLLAFLIVLMSLLIGIVPVLDVTEDYFTNGMYYKQNTLFKKITPLNTHVNFINEYLSIRGNATKPWYSWREVRYYLSEVIFTPGYPGVIGKPLKFYGNAGVCLFKYFVSSHDPQREYTLMVLSVNIVCFIIITGCYGFIFIATQQSTKNLTRTPSNASTTNRRKSSDDESSKFKRQQAKKLQTKISLIILSDFLCWIPFCAVCFLHTLEKIDATPYYQLSSIILIPINSCINPIIYSNATSAIWSTLKKVGNKTGKAGRDSPTSRWKSLNTINRAVTAFTKAGEHAKSLKKQSVTQVKPFNSYSRWSYDNFNSRTRSVSALGVSSRDSNASRPPRLPRTSAAAILNPSAAKRPSSNSSSQISLQDIHHDASSCNSTIDSSSSPSFADTPKPKILPSIPDDSVERSSS